MRRFAQIDSNGFVVNVIVANSVEWCQDNFGGLWLETFKDGSVRKNYAAVGHFYDSVIDAFIPPKPFESWILNEDACVWEAPIQHPNDGSIYIWDEEVQNWVEMGV